jgi:hypothetical protein
MDDGLPDITGVDQDLEDPNVCLHLRYLDNWMSNHDGAIFNNQSWIPTSTDYRVNPTSMEFRVKFSFI